MRFGIFSNFNLIQIGWQEWQALLVLEVSSITTISYVPSQIFEHFISCQFRMVLQAQTLLQVKQYALLPATSFLCVLENAPWRIMESENLQISVFDTNLFGHQEHD
jgi:hypothetical protein